jgi:hypothetical protein
VNKVNLIPSIYIQNESLNVIFFHISISIGAERHVIYPFLLLLYVEVVTFLICVALNVIN